MQKPKIFEVRIRILNMNTVKGSRNFWKKEFQLLERERSDVFRTWTHLPHAAGLFLIWAGLCVEPSQSHSESAIIRPTVSLTHSKTMRQLRMQFRIHSSVVFPSFSVNLPLLFVTVACVYCDVVYANVLWFLEVYHLIITL